MRLPPAGVGVDVSAQGEEDPGVGETWDGILYIQSLWRYEWIKTKVKGGHALPEWGTIGTLEDQFADNVSRHQD